MALQVARPRPFPLAASRHVRTAGTVSTICLAQGRQPQGLKVVFVATECGPVSTASNAPPAAQPCNRRSLAGCAAKQCSNLVAQALQPACCPNSRPKPCLKLGKHF